MADNITTIFYINKQVGASSFPRCQEADRFWNWCIGNHIFIQARAAIGHNSQGDTPLLSCTDKLIYAFLPSPLLPKILRKIHHNWTRIILIALTWPRQLWFLKLLRMSTCPIRICAFPDLLIQEDGQIRHLSPDPFHFTAWCLDEHQI